MILANSGLKGLSLFVPLEIIKIADLNLNVIIISHQYISFSVIIYSQFYLTIGLYTNVPSL